MQKKIFTQSISHIAAIFRSWVSAISVFITEIIHTAVKVTCLNVTDTPLETATKNIVPWRSKNQWHKSCIVHNSLVSCTIPLYCVFIIPLNWIYGVGQVEGSHAWTFLTICFVEWAQKEEPPLIFMAQPGRGVTVFSFFFCESVSVYGNTRAASNLNCSLCLREGRTVPPTQALQDKEPLTQEP